MSISTCVDNAILAIETAGWNQRWRGNWAVGFCIYGALYATNTPKDVIKAVEATIADLVGTTIVSFNDAEGRTKGEVLDLLRRVSARHSFKEGIARQTELLHASP